MKISSKLIAENLFRLKTSLGGNGLARRYASGEPPLRSELFSSDQMERHGKTLAGSHRLSSERAADPLLNWLAENERVLVGVRDLLTKAVQPDLRITPAREWLLDNLYLFTASAGA
ncbi:MAG: hypothetical protein EXQ58_08285 [Acidobacteria bacterium]|nr:hypothetical protein [Acidobacteriota bacterium]